MYELNPLECALNEAQAYRNQVDALSAENAKLRKLAVLQSVIFKHMSTCPTTDCQACPVEEECAESVHLEGALGIDDKETSWLVQWRSEDAADVRAENAKLRDEVERLRQENQSIGMAAYEVGYRNGSIHYELEHCPACKNIADLQEALEENAKLREERREYQTAIDSLVDECTDHKDENAKLLRLLRALALCADDNADCDKCVMNGAVYFSVRQTFCDGMAEELRAVGIEVD